MQALVDALLAYRRRNFPTIHFRGDLRGETKQAPITSTLHVSAGPSQWPAVRPFSVEEQITFSGLAVDSPAEILDQFESTLPGPWEVGGCFIHRHQPTGAIVQAATPGIQAHVLIRWEGEASWRQ